MPAGELLIALIAARVSSIFRRQKMDAAPYRGWNYAAQEKMVYKGPDKSHKRRTDKGRKRMK